MVELKITLTNAAGLHARPAALFVQKAAGFTSKVKLAGNNKMADGKSILAVMGMGLKQNHEVIITAEGADEVECIAGLQELITSNFNEK